MDHKSFNMKKLLFISVLLVAFACSKEDEQAFIDDIRDGGFAGELIVANDLDSVTLENNLT